MPKNIYTFCGVSLFQIKKNQKIPLISFAVSELIRIFASQLVFTDNNIVFNRAIKTQKIK